MTDRLPEYEVWALLYAISPERQGHENYVGADIHDGPERLHFYIWAIRGAGRTVLVDVGFGDHSSRKRGRALEVLPAEALARIGVAAEAVEDVILTHLHYDHAGCLGDFPNARFHLQDGEMSHATGRNMVHAFMRHAYEIEDVVQAVRLVFDERMAFHDGAWSLAPGIDIFPMPGHTPGLQSVRVNTKRGPIVLASDAFHLYGNIVKGKPFPILHDTAATMESWARIRDLAGDLEHAIPGHDPWVSQAYPPPAPEWEGKVMALHEAPRIPLP